MIYIEEFVIVIVKKKPTKKCQRKRDKKSTNFKMTR
jgi:hypothetical protein